MRRSSSTTPALLSIGELAERSGVATTALRYYDQLGLVRPAVRESGGRRRYAASAIAEVGVIRFLGEVGFTLAEIRCFLSAGGQPARQEIVDRKLAELTEQQHRLEVARELLEHGRTCPAGDPLLCSRFWTIVGQTVDQAVDVALGGGAPAAGTSSSSAESASLSNCARASSHAATA